MGTCLVLHVAAAQSLQTRGPENSRTANRLHVDISEKQARQKYKKTVQQTMLAVYKNNTIEFYLLLWSGENKNCLKRSYE